MAGPPTSGGQGGDVSDPLDGRDRVEEQGTKRAKERPVVTGREPEGARVYDRPDRKEKSGMSKLTWALIAIVVIALLLWLVL